MSEVIVVRERPFASANDAPPSAKHRDAMDGGPELLREQERNAGSLPLRAAQGQNDGEERDRFTAAEGLVAEELAAAAGDVCVTNSFQAEDMIVLHMVRQTRPDVPVVFLDTGYHFAEVYEYRDRMAEAWGMKLTSLLPELTVAEQEAQFGILNQTEPSKCCGMRKVKPLFAELERYGLWFTGLRREQAKSRAALLPVEDFVLPASASSATAGTLTATAGKTIRKVSPLTEWTTKDVWQYAALHEIPLLSLYEKGYSSIGCEPCTGLPVDPNDPRSGRWGGQKQECGIHVQAG